MKVVSRMQVEQVTRVNSSLPTCKHRRKQLGIGDVDVDTSASPSMVVCDKAVDQNMSRFYVQYFHIGRTNFQLVEPYRSHFLQTTSWAAVTARSGNV